jgi:HSP20 family protein
MAIVRWSPFFNRALSQWPDLWDDDLISTLNSHRGSNLDVFETDNEVVVRANVAGVSEDDLDITFEKGVLWIKAEKSEEEDDTNKKHYSKSSWSYSYKVAVPGMIDLSDEPSVDLKDGVLVVTFKKAEASKPKKLIVNKK